MSARKAGIVEKPPPYIVNTDEDADRVREEIERRAESLRGIVPIVPMLPTVIRLPEPDTIRR